MNRPLTLTALPLVLWLGAAATAAAQPAEAPKLDPTTISRTLDDLYRSASSRATVSMHVTTPHYDRTLTMTMWTRGRDDVLVRLLSPRKERGIATLKRGTEMWNYLPKIRKTIRVPAAMMSGSWMGSDFSNDDLVRESSWEDDYTASVVPAPAAGEVCVEYTRKPDAPVAWPRVVGCFSRDPLLPLRQEFYDDKGRKARVMSFSDVRALGGRTLPTRMVLQPLLEQGHRTELTYSEMEFDVALADDLFTLTSLRRGR